VNRVLDWKNGNGWGKKVGKGGGAWLVRMRLSDDGSGDASWTERGIGMGMGCWGRKKRI
jgi:hypothetical protein